MKLATWTMENTHAYRLCRLLSRRRTSRPSWPTTTCIRCGERWTGTANSARARRTSPTLTIEVSGIAHQNSGVFAWRKRVIEADEYKPPNNGDASDNQKSVLTVQS
jgi:hypothetical protein